MKPLCAICILAALSAVAYARPVAPGEPTFISAAVDTCSRTDRFGLSETAAEVLAKIQASTGAQEDSPVPVAGILSTCNRFLSVAVDGPNVFAAARDLIATAEHEVDMVFFDWDHESDASRLIGDGLIAAQSGRSRRAPLLVRIVVDDVVTTSISRKVNELYDSQKSWVSRGLDTARVQLQFATSPRSTQVSPNLHDKIIVVDARSVMVTGANVQKHNDPGSHLWHDTAYLFEGDAARSALAAFEDSWTDGETNHWRCTPQVASRDCDKRPHYPQPRRPWLVPFGSQQPGDVPMLAVGRKKNIILSNSTDNPQDIAWLTLMKMATSHIHIESPNINDNALYDAILDAIDRRVTVSLIAGLGFNEGSTDLPLLGDSNLEVVGNLRKEIRRRYATSDPDREKLFQVRWYSFDGLEPEAGNGGRPSHTKYMTADDEVAIVGSANQDTISWNISHEFNFLVDDPATTRQVESSVFLPDWSRAIDSYAELYEGADGSQDIICILGMGNDKSLQFYDFIHGEPPFIDDTWRCDNDETRSVLLHDVEAGRVLRLYDDPDRDWRDDDWVEIVVKQPVARKYVPTYQASFEDADVRMIYHRDNGLDGKVSSAEVSGSPVGPVIDLYEGNDATQDLVCSNRIGGTGDVRFKSDPHCDNDEARSLVLSSFPEDRAVFLYDDPNGGRGDDWAVIVPRRPITRAVVGTFERSAQTADYDLCAFPRNGLDGKVSRMRVGLRSEAEGICGSAERVLSAGRGYTLSPQPAPQYPDPGGELTDGVTATGESWINAAGWLFVDPTITLDLGAVYDLTQVELYVGNSFGNGSFGVFRPSRAAVSVSSDGVGFTPVGDLTFAQESAVGTKEQVDLGRLSLGRSGRYVRVAITPGGPWVMATELVVKGTEGGACPDLGLSCDGPDADLCLEGTIRADCSCGDTTGDSLEICNGVDDDCDGRIDEGACGGPISEQGPYTLAPLPSAQYPDPGGELTDGVTATGESWIDAAGWLSVDPTITLDLGEVFDLAQVELYVGDSFGDGSFGVFRPAGATVSVSSDGETFTPVADLAFSEESAVGTKEQVDVGRAALGTSGRYVRLEIAAGGPWVMVTEVAVFAAP